MKPQQADNPGFTSKVLSNVKVLEWQGEALCPGSCGELVQGTWNGINFLVPCPIELFSSAKVKLRPGTQLVGPLEKPKALLGVHKTLEFVGRHDLGGELTLASDIPAGKGMASSTADISAAIAATAAALGVSLTPMELMQIAISIEPTDGIMLPGITLLDHLKGRWSLPLGIAPGAQILVLDPGGEVDTVQFNSLPNLAELNRNNEPAAKEAFHWVRRGIQEKSLSLLARGTTLSAETNQKILWKYLLPEIKAWGSGRGSFGVIAAHSGTVLGLIYPPGVNLQREEIEVVQAFPELINVWRTRLIPGGIRLACGSAGARRTEISTAGIRSIT